MKILIFGIPGSGKTHLAKKLSISLKLGDLHMSQKIHENLWLDCFSFITAAHLFTNVTVIFCSPISLQLYCLENRDRKIL